MTRKAEFAAATVAVLMVVGATERSILSGARDGRSSRVTDAVAATVATDTPGRPGPARHRSPGRDGDASDDGENRLRPSPTATVAAGARVLASVVAYRRQYDEVSSPSGQPRWELDGAATELIADSDGERAALYDALTTRPLTLGEMQAAQSYGSTLNAAPVTDLAPADQANALRAAWSQQSSLQWLAGQRTNAAP